MALQSIPAFVLADAGGTPIQHPVELMRNLLKELASGQPGSLYKGGWAPAVVSGQMQLQVGAGAMLLSGAESSTQGYYFAWNDATQTLVWPAASGQGRYDTLVLRVPDPQYGTITGYTAGASWEIVQGTPGASPSPVADSVFQAAGSHYVPGAWLRVFDVLVPASATQLTLANVTQRFQYAGTRGYFAATSFSNLPANPKQGDRGYTLDTDKVYYAIGAGPSWISTGVVNRPTFFARQTASQTVANDASYPSTAGATQLTGWTVEQDSHSGFASNAYTIPVTGIYRVTGSWVSGGANNGNSGNRRIFFKNNGALGTGCAGTVHADTNSKQLSVALPGKPYQFSAGDVITLWADHLQGTGTSAVATTVGDGAESTWSITYEHQ